MPVVSNSSPLIALVRIHRLDLIPAILESVLIPPAAAREIRPSRTCRIGYGCGHPRIETAAHFARTAR